MRDLSVVKLEPSRLDACWFKGWMRRLTISIDGDRASSTTFNTLQVRVDHGCDAYATILTMPPGPGAAPPPAHAGCARAASVCVRCLHREVRIA